MIIWYLVNYAKCCVTWDELTYSSYLVIVPPVITTHPMDMNMTLQDDPINVTLTCEAERADTYMWERQNGDIPSGASGVNTTMLTLINLQLMDAGNYRCVASNEGGNDTSNYATLTINGE